MLDKFTCGKATRLASEAPVPVIYNPNNTYKLGGAANVAANIAVLGGKPILMGVVGNDKDSCLIADLLDELNIPCYLLHTVIKRHTTVKTRVLANNQTIVRMDQESTEDVPADIFKEDINKYKSKAAAIIVSDYAKGVVTRDLLDCISDSGLLTFLDPKVQHKDVYIGQRINIMTPNALEAEGLTDSTPDAGLYDNGPGPCLVRKFGLQYALITRGEDGMSLFDYAGGRFDIATEAQSVFDVSGAGDTVIAVLALASISGYTMLESAKIANKAAGIAVGKRGTAAVNLQELENAGKI